MPIAFLLLVPAYLLFSLSWGSRRLGKGCRIAAEWLTDAAFNLTEGSE